ncbi:hypothetical protein [Burkholderia pyrrocinia]|uniref:hypothetical protein n=1 Tax=Burkholderia pyrrocinia TaxID=60550 RepID=UPI00158E4F5E|nr:hypothetical protein [Burkholderia pyrrocinia]
MTIDKSRADALTAMVDDMRAEQTYLGSCREACDNSGRIRWDRLQRVIDHLAASPVEQHEAAPAGWDQLRHSLAIAMCGFGSRPDGKRDLDAAAHVLDALTEPGSPLTWLRTIAQPEPPAQPAPSAPLEGTGNGAALEFLREIVADDYWSESKASRAREILSRAPRTEVAGAVALSATMMFEAASRSGLRATWGRLNATDVLDALEAYTLDVVAQINAAPPAQVATRQTLTVRQRMDLLLVADDMEVSGDAKLANALRALLEGTKQ